MDVIVIQARDTDVLLFLVAHFHRIDCEEVFMMSGTSQRRKYIPIGDVVNKLPPNSVDALLSFHTITGCDSTSYVVGHPKTSAWKKTFLIHHHLLVDLCW